MKSENEDYRAWCARGIERLIQRFPELRESEPVAERAPDYDPIAEMQRILAETAGAFEAAGGSASTTSATADQGAAGPSSSQTGGGMERRAKVEDVSLAPTSERDESDQDAILRLLLSSEPEQKLVSMLSEGRSVDLNEITRIDPEYDFGD